MSSACLRCTSAASQASCCPCCLTGFAFWLAMSSSCLRCTSAACQVLSPLPSQAPAKSCTDLPVHTVVYVDTVLMSSCTLLTGGIHSMHAPRKRWEEGIGRTSHALELRGARWILCSQARLVPSTGVRALRALGQYLVKTVCTLLHERLACSGTV
jgi:hypothetical protein